MRIEKNMSFWRTDGPIESMKIKDPQNDRVILRQCRRIQSGLLLAILVALFLAFPSFAADKMDSYDSTYTSSLNMSDEQIEKVFGIDSTKLSKGPTLQELNEENPSYVKREYNHKQQVIVGSVVMFCVALAMVLMNNYNPKR